MSDWRLFGNGVLLSLPAVALAVAGALFLVDKVPDLERNEQRRVQQEYRELAVEAKETGKGEPFDFKKSGLQKLGGRTIQKEAWGYEKGLVWYVRGGRYYRLDVTPVSEANLRLYFGVIVLLVVLTLSGMTAFGIRYFWKFVKSRDDFLAATAHDLTTPLVGLRMMIGRDDAEARRLNERMLLIVNNIKDFLKLGGRRKPVLKPVDVVALCREAYGLFAADYEDSESGPVIFVTSSSTPPSESCFALADETMLLQILWNLFGNDLKYAAPYGRVEVRVATGERCVSVEFADEGPGLSESQMARAFDRYYRTKTVLSSGKGGFGIGLCTAREFARDMGGNLTVRANRPRGCLFTLTLPRCDLTYIP